MSANDPISDFTIALTEHDLDPGHIQTDGSIHRFQTRDDSRDGKSGAYWHNGNCGWFQDWRTMEKPKKIHGSLSESDKKALSGSFSNQTKVSRKALEAEVRRIWNAGTEADNHPYFKNKGIKPVSELKQYDSDLIVPVFGLKQGQNGLTKQLNGLQRIKPNGAKKFLIGTRKKGSLFAIKGDPDVYIVCEGLATGISIYEATGYSIAVAFDAGNLGPVTTQVCQQVGSDAVIIAADDDHWKTESGQKNTGVDAAKAAAKISGAAMAIPIFADSNGKATTDFNDLFCSEGCDVVKTQIQAVVEGQRKKSMLVERACIQAEAVEAEKKIVNLSESMARFIVPRSYTDNLGKEEFLIDNLVIKNHIVTIIGEAGAGKTTFFFFYGACHMTERGSKVYYIDADSPPSDHKMMQDYCEKHKFTWVSPDVNEGTSIDAFRTTLEDAAKGQCDMTDSVFVFDTLKKFVNLMGKDSTKKFFILARKMTKLGATVILLGHANKYRDIDGNLIPEGVGDVKSDSDELIFFRHEKTSEEGTNVTTMINTEVGAKVRGIFRPISFNINRYRDVSFYKEAITPAEIGNAEIKATDEEILDTVAEYLKLSHEPVAQNKVIEYVRAKVIGNAAVNRIRSLMLQSSIVKGGEQLLGTKFTFTIGKSNVHLYEIAPTVKRNPGGKDPLFGK